MQLLLQHRKPLFHRRSRRLGLTGALQPPAPADQQMTACRHQGLQQHVAVLVAAAGIPQAPLLLEQVKTRAATRARKVGAVEAHQNHHLVGDRPHRLQGTDGEGATAVTEATAVHRQGLLQHLQGHGCIEVQRAVMGPQSPLLKGRRPALRLIGPGPTLSEQLLQQGLQQLHPVMARPGLSQAIEHPRQTVQQRPPAHQAIGIQLLLERCRPCWSQARLHRQHQAQQPTVETPTQAVHLVPAPLAGIQAPAKTAALQRLGDQHRLLRRESLLALQGRIGQQTFQPRGGEACGRQLQQREHRHRQPRTALLTAVGETPGQIDTDGRRVVEHGAKQRCIALNLRRHHQHVAGREIGIGRQPLQDAITHQLHLPPRPRCRLKQQRLIVGGTLQCGDAVGIHQLLLKLIEQGGLALFRCGHLQGTCKQIPFASLPQLRFTGALQQLLKFGTHPPKNSLQARRLRQPAPVGRNQPVIPERGTPTAAALPQIRTRGEQVDLHLQQTGQGLNQIHLHRCQGTDAKQPQPLRQQGWINVSSPETIDGLTHLQPKGSPGKPLGQQSPEHGLPVVIGPRPFPLLQLIGAVEGVIVHGIGDGACQLPTVPRQPRGGSFTLGKPGP